MRLRHQLLTLNLKRKSLPPVLYERIDSNNVRIGTKWFKFETAKLFPWYYSWAERPAGVTIHYDSSKRFISNSWYDINTYGTYEEFEESFNKWIKILDYGMDKR